MTNMELLYKEENKKKKRIEEFYVISADTSDELYAFYNSLCDKYGLVVYLTTDSVIRNEFLPVPNRNLKQEDGRYYGYVRI